MESSPPPQVAILSGPTATGKTRIAIELALQATQIAQATKIEIVNADSLLVYQGLDIGTSKPTHQELQSVPHHLIDICAPDHTFTAGEFFRSVQTALNEIHERGHRALIVGGSGFYLKALLYGLWTAPAADPELRARLDLRSNLELHSTLIENDPLSAERIGKNDRYRLIRALELI